MELVQQLKEDGIAKGLCRQWQMKLKQGLNTEQLVELYVKGIDFCIQKDYPTLDFLRERFKGLCEPFGVFVDDEVMDVNNLPDMVLNGDSKAMVEYDGYSVSRIYARHNSKAAINVGDHAIVTIDAFDNSELWIATSGENAQVIVSVYGNAHVEVDGLGITVKLTNKETY